MSALDSLVLTIGNIHSGSEWNVIPGEAKMGGTIRFFDPGQEAVSYTHLDVYKRQIELLATADEDRKNVEAIKVVAKKADLVFLCLPDVASKEIMAAIGDFPCKVIDTSTAFRTTAGWAYGLSLIHICLVA